MEINRAAPHVFQVRDWQRNAIQERLIALTQTTNIDILSANNRQSGHTLECRSRIGVASPRHLFGTDHVVDRRDGLRSASSVADVPSIRGAPMMKSASSTPFGRSSTAKGANPSTTSTHSIFGL